MAGHTQRASTNTLMFITYTAGSTAGPIFFRTHDAPEYVLAIPSMLVLCAGLLRAVLLRIHMTMENRRRDRRYGRMEGLEEKLDAMLMGMHDKRTERTWTSDMS